MPSITLRNLRRSHRLENAKSSPEPNPCPFSFDALDWQTMPLAAAYVYPLRGDNETVDPQRPAIWTFNPFHGVVLP